MLGNTPNQPIKFRSKNWIEINDGAHGTYNTNSQIKFKTSMIESSLCDYNDAYRGSSNIQVVFENCTPFNDCISKINNTQIDNAKDNDVVIPMHSLREYSVNYSKTSGSLWQYYRVNQL